jgi:uncharacterized protein YvpB
MSRSTLTKMLVLLAALLVGAIAWGSARFRPLASLPTSTPEPLSKQKVVHTVIPSSLPIIEISTSTEQPSPMVPTLTPSLNPTPTRPVEHYIRNISGHHQYFPLGCEAAAAKDWANYFNKDFNEFEFQYKLPLSDNPDFGFVGDVNSPWGQVPPYGYGVYAGPVADLLNAYGFQAKAYKGYTLEQVKDKVAQDKPVIAWVIGNVVGGVPYEYTDSKGNKTIVAAYEHVVIVTGYNEGHVRYMSNGKFYDTPDKVFLNSWGVLGNMVVVDN